MRRLIKSVPLQPSYVANVTSLPRSSFYTRAKRKCHDRRIGKVPRNALSTSEVVEVQRVLHSDEFIDSTPYQVVPKLMDRGQWLCSIRTMYRILSKNNELNDRRNQRRKGSYAKPVVKATAPNQVWSWDITRLPGPFKGKHYYLYVMLDVFSRYVVGWMVSTRESTVMAEHFIREVVRANAVNPTLLTIHSDRGSPMTAANTVALLATLGLSQSLSRPRISNDNPFSEAQFKTLKYHRYFKPWYENVADAERTLDRFFAWYNNDHMHVNLGLMSPAMVHHDRVQEILHKRSSTMQEACKLYPERFPGGFKLRIPPTEVGINLPRPTEPISR